MQQHFNINLFQMERSSFENKHLIKKIIIDVVMYFKNLFGLMCVYGLNEIFFFPDMHSSMQTVFTGCTIMAKIILTIIFNDIEIPIYETGLFTHLKIWAFIEPRNPDNVELKI